MANNMSSRFLAENKDSVLKALLKTDEGDPQGAESHSLTIPTLLAPQSTPISSHPLTSVPLVSHENAFLRPQYPNGLVSTLSRSLMTPGSGGTLCPLDTRRSMSAQLQAQSNMLRLQLLLQPGSLVGSQLNGTGLLGLGSSVASTLLNPYSAVTNPVALVLGSDPSQLSLSTGQVLTSSEIDDNAVKPDACHQQRQEDSITPILGTMDRSRRSESFPMTLHRLLCELEEFGASYIAHFVEDGKAFVIKDQKGFEKKILKQYFPKMGSFGSFQRQLNLYNFRRISTNNHRGAYTHPLFHKDFPQLTKSMTRTKIKGSKKSGNNKCRGQAATNTSSTADDDGES